MEKIGRNLMGPKVFTAVSFVVGLFPGSSQTVHPAQMPGYDPLNGTKVFMEAMTMKADTVVLDMDGDFILGPTKLTNISNKVLVIGKNTFIKAKKGAFSKTSDALLELIEAHNIKILGNGSTLQMEKEAYTEGEWRHAISLRKCKGILIENLTVRDSGGDGIYIAGQEIGSFSEDIIIDNVKSINNKRQGLSIISARNVQVINSVFAETKGTLPGAGVDIEPNRKTDIISNITFKNCVFRNNAHSGALLALDKLEGDSEPVDIFFGDCLFFENHVPENPYPPGELVFTAHKTNPVKGKVHFKACTISSSLWGIFYSRKTSASYSVVFEDFYAEDICRDGSYAAIYLEVPDYKKDLGPIGGFEFKDLVVNYTADVPIIKIRGSKWGTLKGMDKMSGTILNKGAHKKSMASVNYALKDRDFKKLKILKIN